jgi:signal transduction histidine kinase
MSLKCKTKEELQAELEESHRYIRELEDLECRCEKDEDNLRRQNEFLYQVIESLPHPFYVLDANDYTIKLANSAAAFGELTPGATCYALTHRRDAPCDGAEHSCPLQIVKRTRQPVTLEHIHYDKDGNLRNVEVHASPIFDKEGNVVQMIEYSLDITERKRMEQEIQSYAEKVKLFAYSISHDLKSPVIGINGLTRLLHKQYRDVLDEKGKKYCDQIEKASGQVLALIEEINAYVRAKECPVRLEIVKPKEIIETVRGEFATILNNRAIHWEEPDSIPDVKADRISMLRVFRNLVDNALKYGGKDLCKIRVGYEQSAEHHIFFVSDNGAGITEENRQKIFGVFQRQESSTQAPEGTGLGLAIVREIAEKHCGKAWVESEPGRGATFFFSLSKAL